MRQKSYYRRALRIASEITNIDLNFIIQYNTNNFFYYTKTHSAGHLA